MHLDLRRTRWPLILGSSRYASLLEASSLELANQEKNMDDLKYIIMSGNLNDGFVAYGPYDSFDEADEGSDGAEVWIMSLGTRELAEIEL